MLVHSTARAATWHHNAMNAQMDTTYHLIQRTPNASHARKIARSAASLVQKIANNASMDFHSRKAFASDVQKAVQRVKGLIATAASKDTDS